MSAYTSSKQFELGSTAFRQWKADHSHCRFIHGYQLKTELTFGCNTLDDKNWCVDFGGLDTLKQTLRNHFDHTVVVAGDDPELATFQDLDSKGIIQLRIMGHGVGVEKFAEYVFKTADTFVEEASEGRCFVVKAKVTEHEDNYASYSKEEARVATEVTATDESTTTQVPEQQQPESPQPAPGPNPKQGATVGQKPTQGKGNWFAGTTWGD